ncbi:hypothetical protein Tery_3101 [Trichodesmium erythraeum IMS101]|uniref:Transposase n=1 Tax=Trichodesmium erythraeum (strain IMS101) TaxID=203124 RepID=Q10ZU0_TRIEI
MLNVSELPLSPSVLKSSFGPLTLLIYHKCELCWSKLKQFLRSCEARTHESLEQAMAEVVNFITEDDAFGWFNHCGLFT